MKRFTSYGTCALCSKRTTKAAMSRHLGACLAEHEPSSGKKAQRLLRLRIEDAYSPICWMDVEMKATATLDALDSFLRQTWLECCGHLSEFSAGGRRYEGSSFAMGALGEPDIQSMEVQLGEVVSKGSSFAHTYDFGNSTELKLRVTDERQSRIGNEPVRILSRNELPKWECEVCSAPAQWVCTTCMYERENPFYCEAHAEAHDCDDPEMLLPVVNSPRMGVCAYEGPA